MNCSNIAQEETSGIVFSEVQQIKTGNLDEVAGDTDVLWQVAHQQLCHDELQQIAEDSQEVQVVNCASEEQQIDSAGEPDHQQELSPIQDVKNGRRQTVQFCKQPEIQELPNAETACSLKLDLESQRRCAAQPMKPEQKRLKIVRDNTTQKSVPTQKVKSAVIKSAAQLKLTQPILKVEKPEEVLFEVEADLTEFYPSGACSNVAEMEVVRTVDQILKSIQQKFNCQQKQEVGYGAPETSEIESLQQLYRKMRGESDVENRQVPVTNQSLAFAIAHPAENVKISAKAAAQFKELIQEKADREAGLGRFNNCNMRALPVSGAIDLDRNLKKTQRLTKYVQNHGADPRYAVQTPYDNLLLAERYATRQEILVVNRNQQEELVNVADLVKMAEDGIKERKREAQLMVIQQLQESQQQLVKTYGVIPQYEDCTVDQSRVLMEKNSASQNARLLDNAKRALQIRRKQIEKLLNLPFGEERARFVEEGQVEMFGTFLRQARTLPSSQQIEVTDPRTNVKSLEPVCFDAVDDDVFMSFLPLPPKVTTEMSIVEAEAAARARSFFFDQMQKHAEKLKKAMENQ